MIFFEILQIGSIVKSKRLNYFFHNLQKFQNERLRVVIEYKGTNSTLLNT